MARKGIVKIRARIKNGVAEVKTLMPHPMETGTRKDESGKIIPAHYIKDVICEHNDKLVMKAQWGPSISTNPFFAFKVKNVKSGDKIHVKWTDNLGGAGDGFAVLK